MNDHLSLLGFKVKDVVTGFSGVVTSISFELYGCVQGLVNPGLDETGKQKDPYWFDLSRLQKTSKRPVMKAASFSTVTGGDRLPGYSSSPTK
jgi:hypothetical protein